MSTWDPFANLRAEQNEPAEDEDEGEESVGGKADGGAGGERFPEPPNMNDLLRDLFGGRDAGRWPK